MGCGRVSKRSSEARACRPSKRSRPCARSMAFRVLVDPAALAEAEEHFLWLRERAPREAQRWFQGLWNAVELLAEMPNRCSLAPEGHALERTIRQLLFGRPPHIHRILFVVVNDEVRILRIRHAARSEASDIDPPAK